MKELGKRDKLQFIVESLGITRCLHFQFALSRTIHIILVKTKTKNTLNQKKTLSINTNLRHDSNNGMDYSWVQARSPLLCFKSAAYTFVIRKRVNLPKEDCWCNNARSFQQGSSPSFGLQRSDAPVGYALDCNVPMQLDPTARTKKILTGKKVSQQNRLPVQALFSNSSAGAAVTMLVMAHRARMVLMFMAVFFLLRNSLIRVYLEKLQCRIEVKGQNPRGLYRPTDRLSLGFIVCPALQSDLGVCKTWKQ